MLLFFKDVIYDSPSPFTYTFNTDLPLLGYQLPESFYSEIQIAKVPAKEAEAEAEECYISLARVRQTITSHLSQDSALSNGG